MVNLVGLDLDELSKAPLHASLVSHPSVLEAQGQRHVTIRVEWSDKGGRELVGLLHSDLVILRIYIKEAQGFAPYGRVDHLINAR